jgi:hypothetical protein
MYAVVENNQIKGIGDITVLFPNTSFPSTEEYGDFLSENNLYPVITNLEHNSNTEKLVPCEPYFQGGKVYNVKVESISAEDQKDILLAYIDFELISTEGLETKSDLSAKDKQSWVKYREKLNLLKEYSNLSEVTWPEKPVVYGGTGEN